MSREKKFTQGPWAVNPLVAQVDAIPSTIPVCGMLWPTEDRTEAETEANANLIAAAPELLEALEVMAKIAELSEWYMATTGRQIALNDTYSAIKKAYGETK